MRRGPNQKKKGEKKEDKGSLPPIISAKFQEAVLAAGLTPEIPSEILALERKETRCTLMRKSDDWMLMLRDTIEDMGRQWRDRFLNAAE